MVPLFRAAALTSRRRALAGRPGWARAAEDRPAQLQIDLRSLAKQGGANLIACMVPTERGQPPTIWCGDSGR